MSDPADIYDQATEAYEALDRGKDEYHFIGAEEACNMCPRDVKARDAFPIKVVAVVGFGNDWAAYYGPTRWSDERVAFYGEKLSAEQAEPLFCALRNSGRFYKE